MTYEETMDRCSIIRDTLTSGHSITIEPTLENIEWATMCAEAAEKQIPKKPQPMKVAVDKLKIGNSNWCKGTTVYRCPVCKNYISKLYKYCFECGQKIDWGE